MSTNNWPALRQHCAAAGTTPSHEPALLPCPFCGGAAEFMAVGDISWSEQRFYAICKDCDTEAPAVRPTQAAAAADWNRRADATDTTQLATLRQQLADALAALDRAQLGADALETERAGWQAKAERWHCEYLAELAAHDQTHRECQRLRDAGKAAQEVRDAWREVAETANKNAAEAHSQRIAAGEAAGARITDLHERLAAVRDLINSSEYWLPPARFAELIAALGEEGQ